MGKKNNWSEDRFDRDDDIEEEKPKDEDCMKLLSELYYSDRRLVMSDVTDGNLAYLFNNVGDSQKWESLKLRNEQMKHVIPQLKEAANKIIKSKCFDENAKKQLEAWIPLLDNKNPDEVMNIARRFMPRLLE